MIREALLGVYLCLSCLRLSVFPVPGYLFPSSDTGNFQLKIIKYINIFFSLFLSPFWGDPIMLEVVSEFLKLFVVSEFLKLSSFFKFVSLFTDWVTSIILSSRSLIHYSLSRSLLLIPSSIIFILAILFFRYDWLFFIFFRSL